MPRLTDAQLAQLDRYLANDCSAEERAAVLQWLQDDPALARRVDAVRHAIATASDRAPDSATSWTTFRAHVPDWETRSSGASTMASPASSRSMRDETRDVTRHPAHVMTRWARIPGQSGTWRWIGGATLVAGLIVGATVYRRDRDTLWPTTSHTYTTRSGMLASIALPDGSHVTLAPRSRLTVASAAGNAVRDVTLDGEAYFQIAHHPSTPFIVHTAQATTQVLGTSFDVRAYAGDSLSQVVVTDGQVALRTPNAALGTGVRLGRGDRGRMGAAGLATVTHDVDLDAVTSWTNNTLTFQLTPLRDVVRDMERWYDIDIVLADPALGNVPVSIAFDGRSSRAEALTLLANALNVRYHQSGRVVTLDAAPNAVPDAARH